MIGQQGQSQYARENAEFLSVGMAYKANEVLHRIAQLKYYPYLFLLEIAKLFHFNQFQIYFFAHVLNDQLCKFRQEPTMFSQEIDIPEFPNLYNKITNSGKILLRTCPIGFYNQAEQAQYYSEDEQEQNWDNLNMSLIQPKAQTKNNSQFWSYEELKKFYIYLIVIGYSVKFYLNSTTKVYEDEINQRYPHFFIKIFNAWVDKYSNRVLRTNPRKVNEFYNFLLQQEEKMLENKDDDCQYRNYNQIVFELIKATSEGDEYCEADSVKIQDD